MQNIMPFQLEPYNGDKYAVETVKSLKEKFGIKYAVETGSAYGGTTVFLAETFDKVHTIEINKKFIEGMIPRLSHVKKKVAIFNGDSASLIKLAIEKLPENENLFFFIDSHWLNVCPMLDELRMIGKLTKDPIIMIHDFMVPGQPELGYDCIQKQPFNFDYIKDSIEKIYPDGYDYFYNTQEKAAGAKRGIIYITPKK